MSNSTLLPFLYQTRTLQRLPRSRCALQFARSFSVSTPVRRGGTPGWVPPPTKPRSDWVPFELGQSDKKLDPNAKEAEQVKGTITPHERRAFQDIFNEIASRNPTPVGFEDDDAKEPAARAARPVGAVKFRGANEFRGTRRLDVSDRKLDSHKALRRYPSSLQADAALALGIDEPIQPPARDDGETREDEYAGESSLDERPVEIVDEAVLQQKKERWEKITAARAKTEALMAACKTDFELWAVMEKQVFDLIPKLGLAVGQKKGKRRGSGKKNVEAKMEVYGPLYPLHLVHALRLLDSHFAQSSPLVFHVLPRVKELGLASYVLGASTPFYNALMSIYWFRYGDMPAVLSILKEMKEAGLYFDGVTLSIVREMRGFHDLCREGGAGDFLGAVVGMPEYVAPLDGRLVHWERSIERNIRERQKSPGY